jgi:hypothetical protein
VLNVCFRYNLELKKVPGPIKHALEVVLAERCELKAVLMGTRRTDPYSETLDSFQVHTLNNKFAVTSKWEGHVARMGEKRKAYRLLVGKPEGKRPLQRPRHRWVDNIRMGLGEVGWGDVDWIGLAQDRNRRRAVVNLVLNLRVP